VFMESVAKTRQAFRLATDRSQAIHGCGSAPESHWLPLRDAKDVHF
jgi:hypothetical protein